MKQIIFLFFVLLSLVACNNDGQKKDEIQKNAVTWGDDDIKEVNGVIFLYVTSDGTTGKQWIKRLESRGVFIFDYTKDLLLSCDFKPTKGITYKVAIIKGDLFDNNDRTTKNARKKADNFKFSDINPEIACLLREKISDKNFEVMGLDQIVVMHQAIQDSEGDYFLFDIIGKDKFGATVDYYGDLWFRDTGFAFVASQSRKFRN